MIPRQGRVAIRQTAQKPPQPQYSAYSFPGPSLGWVSDQNLAVSQPGAAYILENIFPTATGGIMRRGCSAQANLATAVVPLQLTGTVGTTAASATVTGAGTLFESELSDGDSIIIDGETYTVDAIASDTSLTLVEDADATLAGEDAFKVTYLADPAIKSLFAYETGSVARLFAGADGGIFDVTAMDDPAFAHTVADGYFSTAQYTSTDGTRYVRGVNGVDASWVYDGSDFSTTPTLTFASPDDANTSDILDFVWVYKNRFFFIEKNSLVVWYLPVGQVGGELVRLDLGGVFGLGGRLVFGGTWSIESGDGLNSFCVFATDKGEFAVYAGADPSSASDWSRVGTYVVGKPKGPKAFAYRGGDILVATDIGFVALSSALQKDAATVALSALSAPIENEWRNASQRRVEGDWNVAVWTEGQMVAVALPTGSQQTATWFVANVRTNRWSAFTGWDASCVQPFAGRLFFGSPNGKVYEANTTGADDGAPYVGVYVPVFDQLGHPGVKAIHMARAVMRSSPLTVEQLTVHSDFNVNLPPPPDASPTQAQNQWGVGQWGSAIWGGDNERNIQDRWRNMLGEGEAVTIAHQVTSAGGTPLDTEFIRTDVLFTIGEIQV